MCTWFSLKNYLDDKISLKNSLDAPAKKVSRLHYYKLQTLLFAILAMFCFMVHLSNDYVYQPKKDYLPIEYVDPCDLPNIIPVNEYIKLKANFTKATKGLEALNTIVDFDLPSNFSLLLLKKKQLIASTYSTLEAEFNYQESHRSACYTKNVKDFFRSLEQLDHGFLYGYFVVVTLLLGYIVKCFIELTGCHLSVEEKKSYFSLLFWADVLVLFNALLGVIAVIDIFYPLANNDKYFKEFPL